MAQTPRSPAQYSAAIGAGIPSKSRPTDGASWPADASPAYRASRQAAAGRINKGNPCKTECHIPDPVVPHSDINDNPTNAGATPDEMRSAMESNQAPWLPDAPILRATGPSNTSQSWPNNHTISIHPMPITRRSVVPNSAISVPSIPMEAAHSAAAHPKSNSEAAHQATRAPDPMLQKVSRLAGTERQRDAEDRGLVTKGNVPRTKPCGRTAVYLPPRLGGENMRVWWPSG